jgi:adenylate cyclase
MTAGARAEAAILFVDVSGSTRCFERHGQVAGRAMVARCFDIVSPEIERHAGRVVKTLGDGLLVSFDRAADLVGAARALHRAIEESNRTQHAAERVAVHCGGDVGPVVRDANGDVFGDAVNVAARLQALAGRDQTLVTSDLVAALEPNEREQTRYLGSFPVHGRDAEVETYEVLWRGASTVAIPHATVKLRSSLRLEFQGTVLELPQDRDRLTLGRDAGNDVVVEDSAVSHDHAEIVRRRGLLYLIDRSTNGTFLQAEGGFERHIQHAEHPLEGQGRLLLGHIHAPPITFRVTQQVS